MLLIVSLALHFPRLPFYAVVTSTTTHQLAETPSCTSCSSAVTSICMGLGIGLGRHVGTSILYSLCCFRSVKRHVYHTRIVSCYRSATKCTDCPHELAGCCRCNLESLLRSLCVCISEQLNDNEHGDGVTTATQIVRQVSLVEAHDALLGSDLAQSLQCSCVREQSGLWIWFL